LTNARSWINPTCQYLGSVLGYTQYLGCSTRIMVLQSSDCCWHHDYCVVSSYMFLGLIFKWKEIVLHRLHDNFIWLQRSWYWNYRWYWWYEFSYKQYWNYGFWLHTGTLVLVLQTFGFCFLFSCLPLQNATYRVTFSTKQEPVGRKHYQLKIVLNQNRWSEPESGSHSRILVVFHQIFEYENKLDMFLIVFFIWNLPTQFVLSNSIVQGTVDGPKSQVSIILQFLIFSNVCFPVILFPCIICTRDSYQYYAWYPYALRFLVGLLRSL